jgi:hypothetical protein
MQQQTKLPGVSDEQILQFSSLDEGFFLVSLFLSPLVSILWLCLRQNCNLLNFLGKPLFYINISVITLRINFSFLFSLVFVV